MGFWSAFVQTVIKMIVIAIVGLGGIILGKNLRTRKDKKKEAE